TTFRRRSGRWRRSPRPAPSAARRARGAAERPPRRSGSSPRAGSRSAPPAEARPNRRTPPSAAERSRPWRGPPPPPPPKPPEPARVVRVLADQVDACGGDDGPAGRVCAHGVMVAAHAGGRPRRFRVDQKKYLETQLDEFGSLVEDLPESEVPAGMDRKKLL